MCYSLWCNAPPTMLPAFGRQLELRLMEILTIVKRLYISFKSLVNDFVYSFGRAAILLLVEV